MLPARHDDDDDDDDFHFVSAAKYFEWKKGYKQHKSRKYLLQLEIRGSRVHLGSGWLCEKKSSCDDIPGGSFWLLREEMCNGRE